MRVCSIAVVCPLLAAALVGSAGTAAGQAAGGAEVGKCASATGTIWRRAAEGQPWQAVKQGEALRAGDLLLGTPGAALDSRNGAVRLTFPSNLSGTAPLPIVESAVTLQDSKDLDLKFSLDRGRVDVLNQKTQGEARVGMRLRDGDKLCTAVLQKPATRTALMMIGRWPAGVPFTKAPKPGDGPTIHLIYLVLQGEVMLSLDGRHVALSAPPGPAMIQWDSVTGGDPTPERVEKVPAWAVESADDKGAQEKLTALQAFRDLALKESLPAAAQKFVQSGNPAQRRLAVFVMGAADDLAGLGQAVSTTKHGDVWENAVLALRHWIGRGPGQDLKLYNGLVKDRNFTEVDARTMLQLLHDFGDADLARPELYEMLIDFLDHQKMGVRGLAYWHLSRLAPEGRSLNYDPLAAADSRQEAVAGWRKLIPAGQLPAKRAGKGK